MADVGGVRHIYMLTVRDTVVTGTYCTDCNNVGNLAFIQNGVLELDSMRFDVHNPGPTTYTDRVTARLVNGELRITRQRKSSSTAPTTMVLRRSTSAQPAPAPAAPGAPSARAAYVPPGPAEALSPAKVAGLWLRGEGPGKQYFMFKQVGDQLLGLGCGPCDDPNYMAPLDRISIKGTTLRYSIVHENNALAFYDKGPFSNDVSATIRRHEMHMSVFPSYESPGFTPIELTMLGPVREP